MTGEKRFPGPLDSILKSVREETAREKETGSSSPRGKPEEGVERCCVCGKKLEPFSHQWTDMHFKKLQRESKNRERYEGGGMGTLRERCQVTEPHGGLDRQLWTGWREGELPGARDEGEESGEKPKPVSPPLLPVQGEHHVVFNCECLIVANSQFFSVRNSQLPCAVGHLKQR